MCVQLLSTSVKKKKRVRNVPVNIVLFNCDAMWARYGLWTRIISIYNTMVKGQRDPPHGLIVIPTATTTTLANTLGNAVAAGIAHFSAGKVFNPEGTGVVHTAT